MVNNDSPENYNWNLPLSLEGVSLPKWPDAVFPEPFGAFAKELSRSTETPPELAALLLLAAVATAAQKNYLVQIKPDYCEPVNIWVLPVLPPASRKTKVYNEITFPLRTWEKARKTLIEPLIEVACSRRKTLEARLKELRNRAARTEDEKYSFLQGQIESLEQALPEIPACPQLWTGDVTPEQLACIMYANDEAMSVLSDEGGVFDILGGLYSDGRANIDLFLQAHAASPVRVDRKSGPPLFLERPVLTMGLTIQPLVIKTICSNKTFRGRGLLGRFLFAIPKSNIGSRSLEEPSINPDCTLQYRAAISAILEQCPKSQENKTLHSLNLADEAYKKWWEYAKSVESLMGEEIGHLSHIADWAGKLPGAIARIAALLHIMRYSHQKPSEHCISLEDMSAAVRIGHVLTNHALIVFDLLQEDESMHVAKEIYIWIKQQRSLRITQREILRRFRRYKKAAICPSLEVLKEHEILREMVIKPEIGRPSSVFEVNPYLFR